MFCPNCGKQVNDDSKFCIHCGHALEAQVSNDDNIYNHSYYKESYKKNSQQKNIKTEFSFGESFLKGIAVTFAVCLGLFGILLLKNLYSGDVLSLDKMKYQQYIEDPSLIPELTQPETLRGLVDNLKDVQNFLVLYLKVSDDDMETKLETFDKYRKELLKMQNFNNSNLLQENVKYQIPRDKKEFNTIKKQYDKLLSPVGLTIVADENYSKYRLEEDNRFTYNKYGKYLPSGVSEYLKLRAKYYEPYRYGTTLIVKPSKMAERIGKYEAFMNANKESRYIDEIRDLLFSYSLVYAFTTDRMDMVNINKKTFVKSDKMFVKKNPATQLQNLFSHLASSANGISESQFDDMYPYEYQKNLEAIKPVNAELSDIFTLVRKSIMNLRADSSYEYMYISSTDTWSEFNAETSLKKGDIILARSEDGYDVYDYKYKKANQRIKLEENAKFFVKSGQLLAYSPNHLQISSLDSMYGSFNFRTLSVKAIKKIFPEVLIINIDTFGETSVQIDKKSGPQTYMLISTSGGEYTGYRLSGSITLGELSNIFTVNSDANTQVTWSGEGDCESYHMYFITQQSEQQIDSSSNTVSTQAE